MTSDQDRTGAATRVANCACGKLSITVTGEPAGAYTCSCLECQTATGSAFSYRARFHREAIAAISGERHRWRRTGDAGRWVEQIFCPNCGTLVWMEAEALSGSVVISVGCFADPTFLRPATLYWASRRHAWYEPPPGIALVG
ncbi:GFA family protein [Rhizobiaceae sp. 2RAB30]